MWELVKEHFHALAKPFEGCRLKAYWDPVGFPTQGWGHLLNRRNTRKAIVQRFIDEGNSQKDALRLADQWLQETWPPVSQEMADRWLDSDAAVAFNGARKYTTVRLTPQQWAAVTDFCFNLGVGNYQMSTLRRMINREDDIEDTADQFLRWNKAQGIILPGLTRRCKARRALFLS